MGKIPNKKESKTAILDSLELDEMQLANLISLLSIAKHFVKFNKNRLCISNEILLKGGAVMGKNQYVVRHGKEWAVKGEGNSRATRVVSTQKEAQKIATDIAKNQHSELRVQGRNGQFRICNSYGNDPCPPKDKN